MIDAALADPERAERIVVERARAELDALADRVWGSGNWVACSWCPDSSGAPSRHHVNFHDDQRRFEP